MLVNLLLQRGFVSGPGRFSVAFQKLGAAVSVVDPSRMSLEVGGRVLAMQTAPRPNVVFSRTFGVEPHQSHIVDVTRGLLAEWDHPPIVNAPHAVWTAGSKSRQAHVFVGRGLRTPTTINCGYLSEPEPIVEALGLPLVIKNDDTTMSSGVHLVHSLEALRELLPTLGSVGGVAQRFEPGGSYALRLVVVGDEVVAGIARRAAEGDWRASLTFGAELSKYEPSREEAELAIAATQAVGLDIAGTDVIRTAAGPAILEVNAAPQISAFQEASGVDIAGTMASFALRKARRH